jgi:hypothetical protein
MPYVVVGDTCMDIGALQSVVVDDGAMLDQLYLQHDTYLTVSMLNRGHHVLISCKSCPYQLKGGPCQAPVLTKQLFPDVFLYSSDISHELTSMITIHDLIDMVVVILLILSRLVKQCCYERSTGGLMS